MGRGAMQDAIHLGCCTTDALMGDTRVLVREQQDKVLGLFRRGNTNMLFTTSVAEEGLDVQHCSLVICYDVPTRPLSMVQTVGRARAKNAQVIFMEEASSGCVTPKVGHHSSHWPGIGCSQIRNRRMFIFFLDLSKGIQFDPSRVSSL